MTSTLETKAASPMMEQWHACKAKAKEALLFFRLGDFYEAFYDDAILIAKELDITLTKRQEIPMAGVPHHFAESYIDKLVSKGFSVAIAEQMEDAKVTKGLVKREIVRIVTPATVIESSLLSEKENNFLASITQVNKYLGLSLLDLTTAEFLAIEFTTLNALLDALFRFTPKEILAPKSFLEKQRALLEEMTSSFKPKIHSLPDGYFDHEPACSLLLKHFQVHQLDCFGLKGQIAPINAAGALLRYLSCDLSLPIHHITKIATEEPTLYMEIDRTTKRHLELTESLSEEKNGKTLLTLLDETFTPMGGRRLKKWLLHPLLSPSEIEKRQQGVRAFLENSPLTMKVTSHLKEIRDMERLIMRIETAHASPRDLLALSFSLEQIAPLAALLPSIEILLEQKQHLLSFEDLAYKIQKALDPSPPLRLTEGGIFQIGYSQELDTLRSLKEDSQQWITAYQTELRESTQIKTLKVSFTQAFGFYIEVSRGQSDKVPSTFQRRQTLVNAERFITEELKAYEYKILHAEERMKAIEYELFHTLRKEIALRAQEIRMAAAAIGTLDTLLSFSLVAKKHKYSCPKIDTNSLFSIQEGRHPVLEAHLPRETFIPNDLLLNGEEQKLILLTGPNMSGKSTYIRQSALIAIMAQIGSFVPAHTAHLGIVDKVFSRIGASDDLTKGQSTFMVEMAETANILNRATAKSLVILDEIGRGTSTYDGIAIAWAVAEYLLTETQAKTLFATHYFELTALEGKLKGAVNYRVDVHESPQGIQFLHKIVKGGADKSYGIHVARLAGLPSKVLFRAEQILSKLEKQKLKTEKGAPIQASFQLSLFDAF